MEENKEKPTRTVGSILSMAIGAVIGLAIMGAIGLGGGIPAGIFALLGAGAGELIYKMFAGSPKKDEKNDGK